MQYDNYQQKVNKIVDVIRRIVAHLTLIIAIAILVIAGIAVYCVSKGTIYDESQCFPEITYGESTGYKAKAFLSSVRYEYRKSDSDVWSEEAPTAPGSYSVRAVSKKVFGGVSCSDEHRFKVLPKEIELKLSDTVMYGEAPRVYADLALNDTLICEEFIYSSKSSPTPEVCADINSLRILNESGKDVTDCYIIETPVSTVNIIPRKIYVKVSDAEKVYDGQPLKSSDYEITEGSVAGGDKLTVTFSVSLTDVGERVNTPKILIEQADGTVVTDNMYEVLIDLGKLKVTPRPIRITTNDIEFTYNGESRLADGYTIDPSTALVEGHRITSTPTTRVKDCGTYKNNINFKIKDHYTDKTHNYDVTVINGTVRVKPAPLTVETKSFTRVYDGITFSDPGITASKLVGVGHRISVYKKTEVEKVGTYVNSVVVKIYDSQYNDITRNYSITYNFGEIVVTKRPLRISVPEQTWVYDGEVHKNDVDNMYGLDGLAYGHMFFVKDGAEIQNVGTVQNYINEYSIVDISDLASSSVSTSYEELKENYDVTFDLGTFNVVPKLISVRPAGLLTKVYDGKPLEVIDGDDVDAEGLVDKHNISCRLTGASRTEVGTSNVSIVPDAKITDENGNDVTLNYFITYYDGQLTILPRTVEIISGNAWKRYDGTPLVCGEMTTSPRSKHTLVDGHTVKATVTGTRTEIGISQNTYLPENVRIYDENGKDVTHNYDIYSYATGTLRVAHIAVLRVYSDSATKIYDDKPLMDDGYSIEVVDGKMPAGHKFADLRVKGYIIYVGSVANTVSFKIVDQSGKDVTYLYEVIEDLGTLVVEPRPVLIRSGSSSWVYNGEEGWNDTIVAEGLVTEQKAVLTEFTRVTDAGIHPNVVSVKILDNRGRNVTANYAISYEFGKLEIAKRELKIRPTSTSKVYDGTPLLPINNVTFSGLVKSHRISRCEFIGEITEVGTANSQIVSGSIIILDADKRDVTANYSIVYGEGTITVIPRSVIITSESASKHYDGTPLTHNKCNASSESEYSLVPGHSVIANIYGSRTGMGSSPNLYDTNGVRICDENLNDVTRNYQIVSFAFGTLEVLPAAFLYVTTESDMKYYDGSPLTNGNYSVSVQSGALLDGHKVVVSVFGSITDIGSTDNTATVTVVDRFGNNMSDYYEIQTEFGKLTILKKREEPNDRIYGRVYSAATEVIYLRIESYGDFVDNEWRYAPEYGKTLPGGYSYNYLASFALKNSGIAPHTVSMSDVMVYMLPYYMGFEGEYIFPESDTRYSYGNSEYDLSVYRLGRYDEVFGNLCGKLGDLADEELEYREFVYDTYLNVDAETIEYMKRIIFEQGFDKESHRVIDDVARYIQNSARYDLSYDRMLDSEENVIVSFLSEYKSGVCYHYASAAVMLFRTLGIPARYVEGFAVKVQAGEWTDITAPAHAWVEVYVDGVGWIYVEVTGTSSEAQGTQKPKLEITPEFVFKKYDGAPLYAANKLAMNGQLLELIERGYTYSVNVVGAQTEVGTSKSKITEFKLYDENKVDVTDRFDIVLNEGMVRVTGEQINVALYQLNKYYDGNSLSFGEGDYEIVSPLPSGVTVELKLHIELTSVGLLTLSELNSNVSYYASYKVYLDGVDVTENYTLTFCSFGGENDYIPIRISKRIIELTSESVVAEYNGNTLTNDRVYVSKGTVVQGETLRASANGSIDHIGSVINTINSYVIIDRNGNDVTENYEIYLNEGTLTLE